MVDPNWIKTQKIKKWTTEFNRASGNDEEWQKVFKTYLGSDVWQEKRKEKIRLTNSICEDCGAVFINTSALDVHHITYDRIGGNERMDDLRSLCYGCHKKADKKRERKTQERRDNAYYKARLEGFAAKKYGELWRYEEDEEEVERAFVLFLYKKYCEENELTFDVNDELDILDFWNMVLNGRY